VWRAFGLEEAPADALSGASAAVAQQVALVADDDPFAAALRDCLQGLGVTLADDAPVRVVAGTHVLRNPQRVVAIGDAGAMLLAAEGFAVHAAAPRHGELVRCRRHDREGEFIAARYLRWQLADATVQPGWKVWASDGDGAPQVLVHARRRVACILFRPDSLLSQPAAVELLADAIALCGVGEESGAGAKGSEPELR
jgi:hypothetical protein